MCENEVKRCYWYLSMPFSIVATVCFIASAIIPFANCLRWKMKTFYHDNDVPLENTLSK